MSLQNEESQAPTGGNDVQEAGGRRVPDALVWNVLKGICRSSDTGGKEQQKKVPSMDQLQ